MHQQTMAFIETRLCCQFPPLRPQSGRSRKTPYRELTKSLSKFGKQVAWILLGNLGRAKLKWTTSVRHGHASLDKGVDLLIEGSEGLVKRIFQPSEKVTSHGAPFQ